MAFKNLLALAVAASAVAAAPATTACAYENCLYSTAIPSSWKPAASAFCEILLWSSPQPVTVSTTKTVSTTITVTPAPVSATVTTTAIVTSTATTSNIITNTVTATTTSGVACSGSSTITVTGGSTFVNYPTRAPAAPAKRSIDTSEAVQQNDIAAHLKHEARGLNMPNFFTNGCRSQPPLAKIRAACSCFLTASTVTACKTVTATVTSTLAHPTNTATATSTSTTVVTVTTLTTSFVTTTATTTSCTSTVTPTQYQIQCGGITTQPSASTTIATLTCANTATAPSIVAIHRIEGNDAEGTIFEGCILAGPRQVTTPSGGTHLCDGTNNNANPAPGTAITDQLDAASKQNGFPFDGSWSSQYQDFFITSIGTSTQTSNQYWGVLDNYQYTPTGGCQYDAQPGDQTLWAFDAFNKNQFLEVSPGYAAATAGQGSVTLSVRDGMTGNAFGGATIAGQTSDGNGLVTVPVPSVPGCYQYKATANGALRSNAFYLAVYDAFGS